MGRDVLLMTGTRVLAVLMMLATSVCISRTLGPEGQGVYFLGMMFCATQVQLANLGLHNSHTFLLAGNRDVLPSVLGNTVLASTVVAGAFSLLGLGIWLSLGWADSTTMVPLMLGAAIVPARLFFTLGSSLLVAMQQIRSFNMYMLLGNSFVLAAVFLVSLWKPSVSAYLIATGVGASLCAALLFRELSGQSSFRWTADWSLLASAIRTGFNSYLVCLLTFLVTRLNVFLLENLSGPAAVGQYSVVAQLMDVLLLIPSSLGTVLYPKLVQNPGQRSLLAWRSLGIITLLMAVCLGVTWAAAEPAIRLVYGEAYAGAAKSVLPISPAIFCCALVSVIQPYFFAKEFPPFMIACWLLGTLVLVGTSLWLIPSDHEQGAAWSLSAAHATVLIAFGTAFVGSEWSQCRLRPQIDGGTSGAPELLRKAA